jgi:ferritin-like metal-binding protein YciE
MESSMLEMLKEGTRKRVEERLSYDAKEKNEQIQHHISLEDEVIEMKNEIIELKTAIKGLVEMMTAVYDFEDESA